MLTPLAVWFFSGIFLHERDRGGGGREWLTEDDGVERGSSPPFEVQKKKTLARPRRDVSVMREVLFLECRNLHRAFFLTVASEQKQSIYFFFSSSSASPSHFSLPRLSISHSLSPYGVFLELLSSPHPSVSKSRIEGVYSFSFMALFYPLCPHSSQNSPQPGRSERTEVEQLLFGPPPPPPPPPGINVK